MPFFLLLKLRHQLMAEPRFATDVSVLPLLLPAFNHQVFYVIVIIGCPSAWHWPLLPLIYAT
jgi:hypothetical protein